MTTYCNSSSKLIAMKYIKRTFPFIITLCVIFIFGGINKSLAQGFEGVIHYQFDRLEQQNMGDIEYMIKNDRVRMQFGEGAQSGAMIFLPGKSKIMFVMDQMKSYMSMDMDKETDNDSYSDKWKESTLEKTGQNKTIAGHSCEIWKVSNTDGDKLTMCMADDLGTFMSPGNPMAKRSAPAWAKEIVAEGYMPLEVIEESGDEKTVKMKATKIEEKSLSDDLFTVPEGYNDMSSMMKQMMKQRQN